MSCIEIGCELDNLVFFAHAMLSHCVLKCVCGVCLSRAGIGATAATADEMFRASQSMFNDILQRLNKGTPLI
jgi:hypothetical protein